MQLLSLLGWQRLVWWPLLHLSCCMTAWSSFPLNLSTLLSSSSSSSSDFSRSRSTPMSSVRSRTSSALSSWAEWWMRSNAWRSGPKTVRRQQPRTLRPVNPRMSRSCNYVRPRRVNVRLSELFIPRHYFFSWRWLITDKNDILCAILCPFLNLFLTRSTWEQNVSIWTLLGPIGSSYYLTPSSPVVSNALHFRAFGTILVLPTLFLIFLTFGHSGAQSWAPECPNVKKFERVG